MSAVREKKWSVSAEITVIWWSLSLRMKRAAVMPAIPFPIMAMCIEVTIWLQISKLGAFFATYFQKQSKSRLDKRSVLTETLLVTRIKHGAVCWQRDNFNLYKKNNISVTFKVSLRFN